MNTKVLFAVFKRNFVSYFSSPTGYVFICLFVSLSVFAAFWPNEFFNTNLANLDQLSVYFPFIMLVFIPAITMSAWAEERRQGTDELLLTIPAGDFEIVLGKYLAAVAILSVSLLFSLCCNYLVLRSLGSPDNGLFLANYVGYWLVGLAMLAVGLVASFLTGNLTVAFILGAVFNAPLIFIVYADAITGGQLALAIKQWSVGEQLRDFGHGLVTLSGLVYFGSIVAVSLYLSMVLIGRRHWMRGNDWCIPAMHFFVRTLALVTISVSATALAAWHDARFDMTSEKLSSLSPETVALLKDLPGKQPVKIEAFISPTVPEGYVQTRMNLLNMLREVEARGNGKVDVQVNRTERYSDEATRAEQRYGINSRQVPTLSAGTMTDDNIFLGVAVTCGLQKVIIPFFDRGLPAEYELVRALCSVTQQKRKKVGILQTDAQLFGRFDYQSMSSSNNWPIIDDLKKAYDVVQVDATQPITDRYDVLLAVQPSSLGPEQMNHFVEAVRKGQPTAIFEDPLPAFAGNVPATSAPKRPPQGNPMMMMGQQPQPKGDIRPLWSLLGVDFSADQIVYQDYNPLPKLAKLPQEFVFIDANCGAKEPFNEGDPISSKLQHVLFPFPGYLTKLNASKLKFTPLVRTGERTGSVLYRDMFEMSMFGGPGGLNPDRRRQPTGTEYILAGQIRGPLDDGAKPDAKDDKEKKDEKKGVEINVVIVADIDMLHQEFFRLREQGDVPEAGIHFDFDNVTFVLNVLDELAGDQRFVEIRKRRPAHRTLKTIEAQTEAARKETAKALEKRQKEFDDGSKEEDKKIEDAIAKLKEQLAEQKLPAMGVLQQVAMEQQQANARKEAKLQEAKLKLDRDTKQIETKLNRQVRQVREKYKMWAVLLPPIPPLAVALVVFLTRRAREREGVARSRLRG